MEFFPDCQVVRREHRASAKGLGVRASRYVESYPDCVVQ